MGIPCISGFPLEGGMSVSPIQLELIDPGQADLGHMECRSPSEAFGAFICHCYEVKEPPPTHIHSISKIHQFGMIRLVRCSILWFLLAVRVHNFFSLQTSPKLLLRSLLEARLHSVRRDSHHGFLDHHRNSYLHPLCRVSLLSHATLDIDEVLSNESMIYLHECKVFLEGA